MIDEEEYNQVCERPPVTLKGRVWIAAFLIRNGRACSRLYGDCFENGNGGLVMAHLMREIRTQRCPAASAAARQRRSYPAKPASRGAITGVRSSGAGSDRSNHPHSSAAPSAAP